MCLGSVTQGKLLALVLVPPFTESKAISIIHPHHEFLEPEFCPYEEEDGACLSDTVTVKTGCQIPEVGDLKKGFTAHHSEGRTPGTFILDMCAGSGGALEDCKLLPCSFTMDPTAPLPPKVPPLIFCCFL